MLSFKLIHSTGKRVENGPVAEADGKLQIGFVLGNQIKVGHCFVHTAMLADQHPLKLLVRQLVRAGFGPIGQLDDNLKGLVDTGELIGVD
ncbi:hypothetical protein D3C87_2009570 [compost metagenome]